MTLVSVVKQRILAKQIKKNCNKSKINNSSSNKKTF